jgi:hypothetical protein
MNRWTTGLAVFLLTAAPAAAQTLAEPVPPRRGAIERPAPSKPLAHRDAMVPCPEFGSGFMRIPGSPTCVQVSGRVRGDMQFRQRGSRAGEIGTGGGARLGLDARTPTDLGPVRAVVSVGGQRGSIEPRWR